jgi:hypothetical protein
MCSNIRDSILRWNGDGSDVQLHYYRLNIGEIHIDINLEYS